MTTILLAVLGQGSPECRLFILCHLWSLWVTGRAGFVAPGRATAEGLAGGHPRRRVHAIRVLAQGLQGRAEVVGRGVEARSPSPITHHPSPISPSPITHQSITHHPSVHHPSLITHHPSPITHHPSPITHHPSPITHQSSLITHQSITHHSSPITHHSSLITHHPSLITHHSSLIAH